MAVLCTFELLTDSCCLQVHHLSFYHSFQFVIHISSYLWPSNRKEDRIVVGGTFVVTLTLGSGVLVLHGVGLVYPGQLA